MNDAQPKRYLLNTLWLPVEQAEMALKVAVTEVHDKKVMLTYRRTRPRP